MRKIVILHKRVTITVGVTTESAVTSTVIVVLSLISSASCVLLLMRYCFDSDFIIYNLLRRKKKGHEWPKLKIISDPKAENKKKMAQICCL